MLTLGTAKGILLAEGALHKADFCANAADEKANEAGGHVLEIVGAQVEALTQVTVRA